MFTERAGAIDSERLRILEVLHPELRHDFNSPLGLVKANLNVLETLVGGLAQLAAKSATDGAANGRSVELDLLLENFAPLVSRAQSQTDRVLRTADALLAFSAGDEAVGRADANQAVARALELVSGQLNYKFRVERRLEPLPFAAMGTRDLMHVVVVALLHAAASSPEQTTLSVSTCTDGGGIVIAVETAVGPSAPSPTARPAPDLALSQRLLEQSGGSLLIDEGASGRQYVLRVPCL